MTANLKIVRETHRPVVVEKPKRKAVQPKREGYREIAKRILKGKPPAKRFIFTATEKGENDVVI